MKHYTIMVDAQLDGCKSEMVLYSEDLSYCQFHAARTFYDWLCKNFPLIEWKADDGDDFDEDPCTDYCQYVSYCDPDNPNSYLLAVFNFNEYEDEE